MNPYASAAYNGTQDRSSSVALPFTYQYDVVLTANQSLRDQIVQVFTDADFECRAIVVSTQTGAFQVRLKDASGYQLSNGMVNSNLYRSNNRPFPFPMVPALNIPAGGSIGIDIQDVSGASNTIQICFIGVNYYKVARQ